MFGILIGKITQNKQFTQGKSIVDMYFETLYCYFLIYKVMRKDHFAKDKPMGREDKT